MTKFVLSSPMAPLDYPTLNFTATVNGAILDGSMSTPVLTIPPDSRWSVYGGGSAETGITRYPNRIPTAITPAPEVTDGWLLAYNDAQNTATFQDPAALIATTAWSTALTASTVQKYPITTSGQTIQQQLAQSFDAGAFYQGYDHSQIFESGVHDPIHSTGYNFSATRGRVDNTYGALGWAIEGRYKYLGEIIQEWYVQHVPRAGHPPPGGGVGYRRPIAFSVMEDGDDAVQPYIQGHICASGFQFLADDQTSQILYITAAGLEVSIGHDLYLRATAGGNSKIMWQSDSTIYAYEAISYGGSSVFFYDAQNARVHQQNFFGANISTSRTEFNGKVVAMGSIAPGNSTTGGRPAASSHTRGMWYDNTLGKPIWSDGTVWRDAAGTTV